MEDILFKKNEKKRKKSIVLSIITTIFNIYIIISFISDKSFLLAAVFLILLILSVKLVTDNLLNKPTVIADREGLRIKTNGTGLVEWKYIDGFEIKRGVNTNFVVVQINDMEQFLDEKNGVIKALMRSNIKVLGSPVAIPESELNEPLELVIEKLISYKKSI